MFVLSRVTHCAGCFVNNKEKPHWAASSIGTGCMSSKLPREARGSIAAYGRIKSRKRGAVIAPLILCSFALGNPVPEPLVTVLL